MSAPLVTVTLTTPTRTDDVSALIGIDSAPEITEAIEAPAEVNRFVAPDVFSSRSTTTRRPRGLSRSSRRSRRPQPTGT